MRVYFLFGGNEDEFDDGDDVGRVIYLYLCDETHFLPSLFQLLPLGTPEKKRERPFIAMERM